MRFLRMDIVNNAWNLLRSVKLSIRIGGIPLHRIIAGAIAIVVLLGLSGPASAQSSYRYPEKTVLSNYDEAVFFFGGQFHKDWFVDSLSPWAVTWDDTTLVAAGYQKTWLDWKDLRIGGEVGVAGRFGANAASAELWAAIYARYDGFVAGNFRFTPLFSIGISYATGSQGYEQQRMNEWGRNQPILVYLGPEFAFSLVDQPQWEVFTRFHHRSGAYGLIADLDASNAVTAGVRYKF